MIQRSGDPQSRRLAAFCAVVATIFAILLGGTFVATGQTAAGMMQTREAAGGAIGTPVAPVAEPQESPISTPDADTPPESDPLDGDPLDGDPFDGKPINRDTGAPADETQLEIVRSGRPIGEPTTVSAYDDDPATDWTPQSDADETWFWLDLGGERRVREVRWLAQGTGAIEIAVSSDRQRWRNLDRVVVDQGWQGIELRDDARYVRLTLLPDDEDHFPTIAEAAVYGRERTGTISSAQKADNIRERKRDRQPRGEKESVSEQEVDEDASSGSNGGRQDRGSRGRVRVSAEPGETRCSGNRERCEARQGEVSIEEDCEREGTCTIDVRADGGTAICDASGDNETEAGGGEGKRGGRGGRCEAVADGGTVTIGDIDP